MQHNFKELKIWQNSMNLVKTTYKLCEQLPEEEKFGLRNQMRGSSVSIPSNIAEGSGRSSEKEFIHFLNIAMSSSYELETQLLLSKDIYNLVIDQQIEEIQTLQKMIRGFKMVIV